MNRQQQREYQCEDCGEVPIRNGVCPHGCANGTKVVSVEHIGIGSVIINKFGETFTVRSIQHDGSGLTLSGFFQSKTAWVNTTRFYAMTDHVLVAIGE